MLQLYYLVIVDCTSIRLCASRLLPIKRVQSVLAGSVRTGSRTIVLQALRSETAAAPCGVRRVMLENAGGSALLSGGYDD